MTWLAYVHDHDGERILGSLGPSAEAAAERFARTLPAPLLIGTIYVRELSEAEAAQTYEIGVYRIPS